MIGALDYRDTNNLGQLKESISVIETVQHPLYNNPNYITFDFRLNRLSRSSIVTPVDIDNYNLSDSYPSGKVSE